MEPNTIINALDGIIGKMSELKKELLVKTKDMNHISQNRNELATKIGLLENKLAKTVDSEVYNNLKNHCDAEILKLKNELAMLDSKCNPLQKSLNKLTIENEQLKAEQQKLKDVIDKITKTLSGFLTDIIGDTKFTKPAQEQYLPSNYEQPQTKPLLSHPQPQIKLPVSQPPVKKIADFMKK